MNEIIGQPTGLVSQRRDAALSEKKRIRLSQGDWIGICLERGNDLPTCRSESACEAADTQRGQVVLVKKQDVSRRPAEDIPGDFVIELDVVEKHARIDVTRNVQMGLMSCADRLCEKSSHEPIVGVDGDISVDEPPLRQASADGISLLDSGGALFVWPTS